MSAIMYHVLSKTSRHILYYPITSQLRCVRCLCGLADRRSLRVSSCYRDDRTTYCCLPVRLSQVRMSQVRLSQVRHMSEKTNFIKDLFSNIKQEMMKNKEMKENLEKFRSEADKLEQSDALKKAREKYESIESETSRGSESVRQTLSILQEKLKDTLDEVEKTELGKRSRQLAEDISRTAQRTAEGLSRQSEQIGKSTVFRSVSQGMRAVKDEIDETTLSRARLYKAPATLRKRQEYAYHPDEERPVEANEDATGVVMHKDSRWHQSWQQFKDNNQIVTKMFDMKTRYDESDHVLVRATRSVTDKLQDLFGGVFTKTEMSEVLTEIVKMDPHFDKERFIKECQYEIIPNVLEAMVRGELEILKDWCYEAAYNTLAQPIKQVQTAGCKIHSRVLDVNHVDIVAGKMMDQGPVLVISFNAQQVIVVKNANGSVVEGDPNKIMKIFYVWAFCRDQAELDPKAAWRIIDLSSSPSEQWL